MMQGDADNYACKVFIVIGCSSVTDYDADIVRDGVNHRAKHNDHEHSAFAIVALPSWGFSSPFHTGPMRSRAPSYHRVLRRRLALRTEEDRWRRLALRTE